jgi:multiple sugar transport system substrate-binding protein
VIPGIDGIVSPDPLASLSVSHVTRLRPDDQLKSVVRKALRQRRSARRRRFSRTLVNLAFCRAIGVGNRSARSRRPAIASKATASAQNRGKLPASCFAFGRTSVTVGYRAERGCFPDGSANAKVLAYVSGIGRQPVRQEKGIRMQYRRLARGAAGAVAVILTVAVAAGCSSSKKKNDNGGGGSSGGGAGDRGPITMVQGKDTSGILPGLAQLWNKDHPTEKVTMKQQTDQADQQHDDLVQHFQAKDPSYDVVSVDVIWTAEFAAKQWLVPLKGDFAINTDGLLAGPVKAATYNGTLYAAPETSDGGLLYYRKDLVPTAPTTYADLIADCAKKTAGMACYAGQFAKYEGLTCNASEAINSAGGEIVKADGKTPDVETDQAKQGLDFLVNGFKQGYISKEAITYQEEDSRNAFQSGKALFLRNWPYVYNHLANDKDSKVKDKFGVAPLPGLNGPGTSTLGGHNFAISQYSKHKATALDFLKFIMSAPAQSLLLNVGSLAPVLKSSYSDPALIAKFGYLPTLEKSIDTAIPRPVTPFYPAVTQTIETNVYQALQGSLSVDAALANIQKGITEAAAGK